MFISPLSRIKQNSLESTGNSEKNEDTAANELLSLNWAYQDLILQTYVWDRRLQHLSQYAPSDEDQVGTERVAEESTNNAELQGVSSQDNPDADRAQLESESNIVAKEFSIENSIQEDTEKLLWAPFAELKSTYHGEISDFNLTRFSMVNKYTPIHLLVPPLKEERYPICFSVGPNGSILLVCEDEISSIISRALAISEIKHNKKIVIDPMLEKSDSLLSTTLKLSSADSIYSSDSLDEAIPLSKGQHPEVIVDGRLGLKGKYAVACICAEDFYNLRKKCCQSEMKYIISLSRYFSDIC
jgi:1-phosphatidylinositol-3-phosphate 5-kinase